jgi:hypothetical protein
MKPLGLGGRGWGIGAHRIRDTLGEIGGPQYPTHCGTRSALPDFNTSE